jgi:hypothetical protein
LKDNGQPIEKGLGMNLRKIIIEWLNSRSRKAMQRKVEAIERRRAVIRAQMASRRARKQAWRPLAGSLKDATTEALRVETKLARMNGLLEG